MRYPKFYDVNNVQDLAAAPTELLTAQNSSILRSLTPQRSIQSFVPEVPPPQIPTGGNWDGMMDLGTAQLGYSDRSNPASIDAAQRGVEAANMFQKLSQGASMRANEGFASNRKREEEFFDNSYLQALQNNPLLPNMDQKDLLAAQIARDPRGDVRRMLMNLTPQDSAQGPSNMPRAYLPEGGIGGAPNTEAMRNTLDTRLANHPEFIKMISKDPKRAMHVYKAITGRDYGTDAKMFSEIETNQDKFGIDFTQNAIKRGAKFDPVKGTLQLWQDMEGPPRMGDLSGTPTVSKQLGEATPEQTRMYRNYYQRVTGQPLDYRGDKEMARVDKFSQDPIFKNEKVALQVSQWERALGRTLNADEKLRIAQDTMKADPTIGNEGNFMANMKYNNPLLTRALGKWAQFATPYAQALQPIANSTNQYSW